MTWTDDLANGVTAGATFGGSLALGGGGPVHGTTPDNLGQAGTSVAQTFGLGSPPPNIQAPYQVNQSAFQNPLAGYADVGRQLGGALGGYTHGAYQPVNAAASPYTGAGAGGQLGVANTLGSIGAGTGPSLANVQAGQQGASNLAQTESMLGSARGAGSPAAAQLGAQNALMSGQQQIAQNAIQGRTAEELGALGAAGGQYGQVAQTGLGQQGQANAVGQGNAALNAQVQTNYLQALAAQNAQQQAGAIAGQNLGAQNALGYSQLASGNYNAQAGRATQDFGAVLGALGGAAKGAGA